MNPKANPAKTVSNIHVHLLQRLPLSHHEQREVRATSCGSNTHSNTVKNVPPFGRVLLVQLQPAVIA